MVDYNFYRAPEVDLNPAYALALKGKLAESEAKGQLFDKLTASLYQQQQLKQERTLQEKRLDFEGKKQDNLAHLREILQEDRQAAQTERDSASNQAKWEREQSALETKRGIAEGGWESRKEIANLRIGSAEKIADTRNAAAQAQETATAEALNTASAGGQVPFAAGMGFKGMSQLRAAQTAQLMQQREVARQAKEREDRQAISGEIERAGAAGTIYKPEEAEALRMQAEHGDYKQAAAIHRVKVEKHLQTEVELKSREDFYKANSKDLDPNAPQYGSALERLQRIKDDPALTGESLKREMSKFQDQRDSVIKDKLKAEATAHAEAQKPHIVHLAGGITFTDLSGVSKGGKFDELTVPQVQEAKAAAEAKVEKSSAWKSLMAIDEKKMSAEEKAAARQQMIQAETISLLKEMGWKGVPE